MDDDFEIKSKIYNLNCLFCFIQILYCKMTPFFRICKGNFLFSLSVRGRPRTAMAVELSAFETSFGCKKLETNAFVKFECREIWPLMLLKTFYENIQL